jgi:hypothetical protein
VASRGKAEARQPLEAGGIIDDNIAPLSSAQGPDTIRGQTAIFHPSSFFIANENKSRFLLRDLPDSQGTGSSPSGIRMMHVVRRGLYVFLP